jgi:hypothetical protein
LIRECCRSRPAASSGASTLRRLHNERPELYLYADDDRVDTALDELRPLDEPDTTNDEMREWVRAIVRDELEQ